MALIDLKDLKYFIGCNQNDSYFYNFVNNSIHNIEDIISTLSITKKEFIENCFYFEYISLPCLYISVAFDGFIDSLNNKKISSYFDDIDKKDVLKYWIEFDKTFHVGLEKRLWDKYYDEYVHKKAIDWCKECGISYR